MRRRAIALATLALAVVGATPAAAAPPKQLYVSLGDSDATGYQPGVVPGESGNTARGGFVDVTAASGAYTPFDRTITLFPYGTVPIAVARVCELSYFCALQDIHARTDGYALIARLVGRELPRRG